MDPILVKEQPQEGDFGPAPWGFNHNEYHSPHVHSPLHEFNGYNFMPSATQGLPLDASFTRPIQPSYSVPHYPSPQPIFTAQWPSMLTNPSAHGQVMPAPLPLAPAATYATAHPLPPLAAASGPAPTTTARRTLTDQDRRRMCQYHEDNPTVKQTEIGAMFGVERSTVSKVLRQKEKYLHPEDGSRSPIKRAKGKFPDIERALSNWARNHQRQGLPLTDGAIRDKARFFATTVGGSDCHLKVNSNSWLEKFKQKNHLLGQKPKKSSSGGGDASELNTGAQSGSPTPNAISPTSPTDAVSPTRLSPVPSQDDLRMETQEAYLGFSAGYQPGYSHSTTSLASRFSDNPAPSVFSTGSQASSSPFYSPDGATRASPFLPAQISHGVQSSSANAIRPRSQTFPMLGIETSVQGSSDAVAPKHLEEILTTPVLGTPVEEYLDRSLSVSSLASPDVPPLQSGSASTIHTPNQGSSPLIMAPPPNPLNPSLTGHGNLSVLDEPPTQDEARRALELVMNFFQSQPSGIVDPQEYITMGKLMEKLKVHGSIGELPGGMHSIDVEKEISRKRSIHSL